MKTEPMDQSNLDFSLFGAAEDGDLERLIYLLDLGAAPQTDSQNALAAAAEAGHEDCIKVMLPYCEVSYVDSEALYLAFINGHSACFKLLIEELHQELPIKKYRQACFDVLFRSVLKNSHPSWVSPMVDLEYLIKQASPMPELERNAIISLSKSNDFYINNERLDEILTIMLEREHLLHEVLKASSTKKESEDPLALDSSKSPKRLSL